MRIPQPRHPLHATSAFQGRWRRAERIFCFLWTHAAGLFSFYSFDFLVFAFSSLSQIESKDLVDIHLKLRETRRRKHYQIEWVRREQSGSMSLWIEYLGFSSPIFSEVLFLWKKKKIESSQCSWEDISFYCWLYSWSVYMDRLINTRLYFRRVVFIKMRVCWVGKSTHLGWVDLHEDNMLVNLGWVDLNVKNTICATIIYMPIPRMQGGCPKMQGACEPGGIMEVALWLCASLLL